MAQSKLNDLAGNFGKGGSPRMGLGLSLLGIGASLVYGISQSMYTGELQFYFLFGVVQRLREVNITSN